MTQAVNADIAYIRHAREMMEIEMKASPEFEKFANFFVQDVDDFKSDHEGLYGLVLKSVKGKERINLREFLDSATQDTVSDQELMELWTSVNDEICCPEGGYLRAMLRDARDRL